MTEDPSWLGAGGTEREGRGLRVAAVMSDFLQLMTDPACVGLLGHADGARLGLL